MSTAAWLSSCMKKAEAEARSSEIKIGKIAVLAIGLLEIDIKSKF